MVEYTYLKITIFSDTTFGTKALAAQLRASPTDSATSPRAPQGWAADFANS